VAVDLWVSLGSNVGLVVFTLLVVGLLSYLTYSMLNPERF
jgi:K+-transporting ATPase KdpF subunit